MNSRQCGCVNAVVGPKLRTIADTSYLVWIVGAVFVVLALVFILCISTHCHRTSSSPHSCKSRVKCCPTGDFQFTVNGGGSLGSGTATVKNGGKLNLNSNSLLIQVTPGSANVQIEQIDGGGPTGPPGPAGSAGSAATGPTGSAGLTVAMPITFSTNSLGTAGVGGSLAAATPYPLGFGNTNVYAAGGADPYDHVACYWIAPRDGTITAMSASLFNNTTTATSNAAGTVEFFVAIQTGATVLNSSMAFVKQAPSTTVPLAINFPATSFTTSGLTPTVTNIAVAAQDVIAVMFQSTQAITPGIGAGATILFA